MRRDRLIRRFARGVAVAIIPLYVAGIAVTAWLERRLNMDGLGITGSGEDRLLVIGFGAFAVVGALLVGRRPAHPIGWIMVTVGFIVGVIPATEAYAALVMTTTGRPDALATFGAWANEVTWWPLLVLVMIYLPLLFPDGRLPSPRWRPIAWLPGLSLALLVLLSAVRETLVGQHIPYEIANPVGIAGMPSPEESRLGGVILAGVILGQIGALAAVVVRYRRSRGVERQQLKWFLLAAAPSPFLFIADDLAPLLSSIGFLAVLMGVPTAVGIAILRYRLYDIDLIIRRTAQYTVVTVAMAAVYFGSVLLLQSLLERVNGRQSPLVVVLSTLFIAALFNPLRRRSQLFVDRRFFRQKYDAARVLAGFAETTREETDLEGLSAALSLVVRETLQPKDITLWLKREVPDSEGR